jgi:hypothetical protein
MWKLLLCLSCPVNSLCLLEALVNVFIAKSLEHIFTNPTTSKVVVSPNRYSWEIRGVEKLLDRLVHTTLEYHDVSTWKLSEVPWIIYCLEISEVYGGSPLRHVSSYCRRLASWEISTIYLLPYIVHHYSDIQVKGFFRISGVGNSEVDLFSGTFWTYILVSKGPFILYY